MEVTFPSDESWMSIPLHGYGSEIKSSPGAQGAEEGVREEYIASGWVSAPTPHNPDVRHCLYLALQVRRLERFGL